MYSICYKKLKYIDLLKLFLKLKHVSFSSQEYNKDRDFFVTVYHNINIINFEIHHINFMIIVLLVFKRKKQNVNSNSYLNMLTMLMIVLPSQMQGLR